MSGYNFITVENKEFKKEGSKLISVKSEGSEKISKSAHAAVSTMAPSTPTVDSSKPVTDNLDTVSQPTVVPADGQVVNPTPVVTPDPVISVDVPNSEPLNVAGATFQPAPAELAADESLSDMINPFAEESNESQVNNEPENVVPVSIEDSTNVEVSSQPTTNELSDEELTRQMNDLLNKSNIKQNEIKKMIMSYFNAGLYFAKIIDRVETVNLEAAHIAKETSTLAKVNQAMQQSNSQQQTNEPEQQQSPVVAPAENQTPVLQKVA